MEEHLGRHLTGLGSLPLEVIVDAVAEGVIVLDGDFVVQATNFAAEQMFAPWFVLRVGEQPQAADFIDANGRRPPVEEWPFVLTMADGQPRQDVVLGIRNPTTERTGWFSISTRLAETTDASRLLVATFTDVTTAVEGARALQLRAEAEQFASSVAARFAAADADDIETMVSEALADIGQHLGADTAALWRRDHGEDLLVLRRSWRRPGSPPIELPDSYSFSDLVAASRALEPRPARPIVPDDYPEPIRTALREGGRAAHLYLPLRPREELRGAVVVLWASVPTLRPEQIEPLSVLGDVLVSAIDVASSVMARRRSEERAAALVAHTTELVAVVDGTGRVSYANPRFAQVIGVTAGDALRLDLVHPDDQAALAENMADALSRPSDAIAVTGRVAHPDGGWRWLEGTLTNLLLDPAVTGLVANLRDVSERVEAEGLLARAGEHDVLTGLPNGRGLRATLRALAPADEPAMLVVDLHRVRDVNERHGTDAGDELLRAVGQRIVAAVGEHDIVARLTGDRFAVLQRAWAAQGSATDPESLARELAEAVTAPYRLPVGTVEIGASVGVAAGRDHDALVHRAEDAAAWAQSTGAPVAAHDDVRETTSRRRTLQEALRHALEQDTFVLRYRSVVDLASGTVVNRLADARWRSPVGLLGPDVYVPLATGPLSRAITTWTVREAARAAASGAPVTVGLHHHQIADDAVATLVGDAIAAARLPAGRLTVQLSSLGEGLDGLVSGNLAAIRGLGVRVAVGDVGDGVDALRALDALPVDILCLGRRAMAAGTHDEAAAEVVRAVVALAHARGTVVIADGVDDPVTADVARRLGCDQAAGDLGAAAISAAPVRRLPLDPDRLDLRPELPTLDELARVIRSAGQRMGPARVHVLQAMLATARPFTADEIAATVPDVHLATVYRTLETLEQLRVLIRVQATRGAARYEFASASRTRRHLVCTRCGRDLIVPATAFDDLRATMLDRYGFHLHPVQGALPGVCHHCETS